MIAFNHFEYCSQYGIFNLNVITCVKCIEGKMLKKSGSNLYDPFTLCVD